MRSISPDPICARENCIILLNSWVGKLNLARIAILDLNVVGK